jgi:hypothetical protein
MDENMNLQPNDDAQSPRPRRRRKRTKWQIFKEAYLPYLIMLLALILIVTFVVGSLGREKAPEKDPAGSSTPPSTQSMDSRLEQEARDLLAQAEVLAKDYDYEGAMKLLATYSGGINTHDGLMIRYQEYHDAFASLIPYRNINEIPNLSFRLLIADLSRALNDEDYG